MWSTNSSAGHVIAQQIKTCPRTWWRGWSHRSQPIYVSPVGWFCVPNTGRSSTPREAQPVTTPTLTNPPARGRNRVSCMGQCQTGGEITTGFLFPRSDSCDKRGGLCAGKSAGLRRENSVLRHYSHFFHTPLCCEQTVITISVASSEDEDTKDISPWKDSCMPKKFYFPPPLHSIPK